MSVEERSSAAAEKGEGHGSLRVAAPSGAPPLGAIFGATGVLAAAAVALLGLDRLPFTFCVFKGLTGQPGPICGSTRVLGRLFALDPSGALTMNPFTTLVAVTIAAWAVADLVLLPRKRALRIQLSPRLGLVLRIGALVAFLANWVYLVWAGR
jgi:hypothetical protein